MARSERCASPSGLQQASDAASRPFSLAPQGCVDLGAGRRCSLGRDRCGYRRCARALASAHIDSNAATPVFRQSPKTGERKKSKGKDKGVTARRSQLLRMRLTLRKASGGQPPLHLRFQFVSFDALAPPLAHPAGCRLRRSVPTGSVQHLMCSAPLASATPAASRLFRLSHSLN